MDLLRLCVRDVMSQVIDARGDGTSTLQQSTTQKADTMRVSDKMDSCNIREALQILSTSARATQTGRTAAEIRSLVAVKADAQETAHMKDQCSAVEQTALSFALPPAKLDTSPGTQTAWLLQWAKALLPGIPSS